MKRQEFRMLKETNQQTTYPILRSMRSDVCELFVEVFHAT